jgi:hypothetical protein
VNAIAPDRRRGVAVAVLLALLAIAAIRDLSRLGAGLPWRTMDDFPDFYCAGWSIDRGASPYTYEPLHACEHRTNLGTSFRAQVFAANPSLAIPAPLPGYDFFPYMAMARLPFDWARTLDAIAIVAAAILCAIALAAIGIPLDLAFAALALSTAYIELNTGQAVPFALLALLLCGVALARKNDLLAGVLAGLTAIEPTVGLPVALSTLLFVPGARWAVVATAAALAAAAVAAVGWHSTVIYLAGVVPAQAHSELHFPFQYSLAYALAFLGAAPPAARAAGALSYPLMAVVGLTLARRARQNAAPRELLVFLPALCTAIGGAYLHAEELCLALPALLVLAVNARGTPRYVLGVAICALAVPWILVWGSKQLFLASIFVCAVILLRLLPDWRAVLASLLVLGGLIYAFELHPPHLPVPASATQAYAAGALVQDEWQWYAEERATSDPLWLAIKLPTWAALLAALVVAVQQLRSPPASESTRESSRGSSRPAPA